LRDAEYPGYFLLSGTLVNLSRTASVLHGYVQTAETVAYNTQKLRDALEGVANLHYVKGPDMPSSFSSLARPWWFLGEKLEFDATRKRWDDVVRWWSEELSARQYDGIIGLSQGSAMAALLISMVGIL
jgi:hypothetical protein